MDNTLQWLQFVWLVLRDVAGWILMLALIWFMPRMMGSMIDKATGGGYYDHQPTLRMQVRRIWCRHRRGMVRGRARYGKLTMLCLACGADLNAGNKGAFR